MKKSVKYVTANKLASTSALTYRSKFIWVAGLFFWFSIGFLFWFIPATVKSLTTILNNTETPPTAINAPSLDFTPLGISDMNTFYATAGILATLLVAMYVNVRSTETSIFLTNNGSNPGADETSPMQNKAQTESDNSATKGRKSQTPDHLHFHNTIEDLIATAGTIRILWLIAPVLAYWISATPVHDENTNVTTIVVDPAALIVLAMIWAFGLSSERTRSRRIQTWLSEKKWEHDFQQASAGGSNSLINSLPFQTYETLFEEWKLICWTNVRRYIIWAVVSILILIVGSLPSITSPLSVLLKSVGASMLMVSIPLSFVTYPYYNAQLFSRNVFFNILPSSIFFHCFEARIDSFNPDEKSGRAHKQQVVDTDIYGRSKSVFRILGPLEYLYIALMVVSFTLFAATLPFIYDGSQNSCLWTLIAIAATSSLMGLAGSRALAKHLSARRFGFLFPSWV